MGLLRPTVLLFSLLAVTFHQASAINYCPPVWTQYQLSMGSFCYRLFSMKKTWREAEANCRMYSICQSKEMAHLVSVGSAEEDEFVNSYWKEMRGPFEGKKGIWLGYHKNTTTPASHWTWTDNLKTAYENWGSDTKRAAIVGNCSQQISTEKDWPTWQQDDCEKKQHFMCKMHAM